MTPERRREIEAMVALGYGEPWRSAVVDLLDEVRRLPVIPTCGDCGNNVDGRCMEANSKTEVPPEQRDHRGYAMVPYDDRTGDYLAPPTWCPFRGEKR